MGIIEDMLQGKTPSERNAIKVREFAKLTGETFTRGQFQVTITQGPRVIILKEVPILDLVIEVRRNGNLLPIDGHLRFVNPPIRITDGTTREVVNPQTGIIQQTPNFVESPRQALRQIIIDAIVRQLQ